MLRALNPLLGPWRMIRLFLWGLHPNMGDACPTSTLCFAQVWTFLVVCPSTRHHDRPPPCSVLPQYVGQVQVWALVVGLPTSCFLCATTRNPSWVASWNVTDGVPLVFFSTSPRRSSPCGSASNNKDPASPRAVGTITYYLGSAEMFAYQFSPFVTEKNTTRGPTPCCATTINPEPARLVHDLDI